MQKRSFSEKELKNVRYCYFKIPRGIPNTPESIQFYTTVSVAYHGNEFGLALQSPKDEFNRGIGRSVACGRLTLDKTRQTISNLKPEEVNKRAIGKHLFEYFMENPDKLPPHWDNVTYEDDDDASLAVECLESELKAGFIDYLD